MTTDAAPRSRLSSHALQSPSSRIVHHRGAVRREQPSRRRRRGASGSTCPTPPPQRSRGHDRRRRRARVARGHGRTWHVGLDGRLLGTWVFMAAAGLLVAEARRRGAAATHEARPTSAFASVRALGDDVSRVTGATYAFLHYALLVAYAAQGGGLLAGAVGAPPRRRRRSGLRRCAAAAAWRSVLPNSSTRPTTRACAVVAASFVTLLCAAAGASTRAGAFRLARREAAPDPVVGLSAREGGRRSRRAHRPRRHCRLCIHNVIPTVSRRLGFDRARIASAWCSRLGFSAGDVYRVERTCARRRRRRRRARIRARRLLPRSRVRLAQSSRSRCRYSRSRRWSPARGILLRHAARERRSRRELSEWSGRRRARARRGAARAAFDTRRELLEINQCVGRRRLIPAQAATDPGLFLPALDAAGRVASRSAFGIMPAACAWRRREDGGFPARASPAAMRCSPPWSGCGVRDEGALARVKRTGCAR